MNSKTSVRVIYDSGITKTQNGAFFKELIIERETHFYQIKITYFNNSKRGLAQLGYINKKDYKEGLIRWKYVKDSCPVRDYGLLIKNASLPETFFMPIIRDFARSILKIDAILNYSINNKNSISLPQLEETSIAS